MFGLVTKETVMDDTHDAIIGLAYPELAEKGIVPFFDHIMIMRNLIFQML